MTVPTHIPSVFILKPGSKRLHGLKRGSNKTYLHAGRVGVSGEAAPTVNQTIETATVLSVTIKIVWFDSPPPTAFFAPIATHGNQPWLSSVPADFPTFSSDSVLHLLSFPLPVSFSDEVSDRKSYRNIWPEFWFTCFLLCKNPCPWY